MGVHNHHYATAVPDNNSTPARSCMRRLDKQQRRREQQQQQQQRLLMISDIIACDFHGRTAAPKRRSTRLITTFIFAFLGALALFSSYESVGKEEDDHAREKRQGKQAASSATMIVSVMHVDYGVLHSKEADSIVLPAAADESILEQLETCCGYVNHVANNDERNKKNNNATSNSNLADTATLQGDALSSAPFLCEPTTQIRVTFHNPFWSLQALDATGKGKNVGGDEYFVVLSSTAATTTRLVAKVLDQGDGTYDLDFIEPPLSSSLTTQQEQSTTQSDAAAAASSTREDGSLLTVHLLYTCGMGQFGPPLKSTWTNSGSLLRVYGYDDANVSSNGGGGKPVRLPLPSLIRRPWNNLQEVPSQRQRHRFVRPRQRRTSPHDDDDGNSNDSDSTAMNLLQQDYVIFFGDENMRSMGRAAEKCLAEKQQGQDKDDGAVTADNDPIVLVGDHSVPFSFGNVPQITHLLDQWHGRVLRFPNNQSVSLVMGFNSFGLALDDQHEATSFTGESSSSFMGTMDKFLPLSYDQVDQLMACQALIRLVREEYPGVRLYWRLPLPIPLQRIPMRCHQVKATNNKTYHIDDEDDDDDICPESMQCLSYYRMQQMYQAQNQLMEELGVAVLDLFDAFFVSPEQYDLEQKVYSGLLHERFVQPLLGIKETTTITT